MSRLERLAPLSAFLVTAFIVASFIVTGGTPDNNDSIQKVVSFYTDNKTQVIVGSILATLGAGALVWFAASLRAHIRQKEGGAGRVSALVLAGAIILAVGITIFAGIEVTAADGADHHATPAAMQVLNLLDNNMFLTFALGNILIYFSLAVAILRYHAFPRWMGWVAVVFAVISISPIFWFGILLSGILYPLLGWLIYREQGAATAATGPSG